MTPLDWVIIVIFIISFATAAMNGFFVEVFSIVGLIAGIVTAGMYYAQTAAWMLRYISSVPVADAASFLLIVVAVLVAAGIAGRVARFLLRKVGLGWIDRLLGLVFGAVKGGVLVTALAMTAAAFFPDRSWVLDSRLLPYFVGAAQQGSGVLPGSMSEKVRQGVRIFRKDSAAGTAGDGTVTF